MKLRIIVCGVLSAGVLVTAQRIPELTLDATAFTASPVARTLNYRAPSPPFLIGERRSKAINVRLASIERQEFNWDDSFAYEVTVENTGKEPITLPWSPDAGAFSSQDRLHAMSFALEVASAVEKGTLGHLDAYALWGSDEVPSSLVSLKPGQRASIRLPGRWIGSNELSRLVLRQEGGVVRVSATVHVFEEFLFGRSENDVAVRVSRKATQ